MRGTRPAVLLVVVAILSWLPDASAQDSVGEALALLPICAQPCALPAVQASPCSLADTTCVCTDAQLAKAFGDCCASACKPMDIFHTQKVFNTACGVSPRDKRAEFRAGTWATLVICVAAVAVRLAQNRFPRRWAWDDFFILVSLCASVAFWYICVCGIDELGNPMGVDVWALTHDEIAAFLKILFIAEVLYVFDIGILKTSFLFFFLRVFCPPGTDPTFFGVRLRTLIMRTVVFNLVFTLIFLVTASVQCIPLSLTWNGWDGEHNGEGGCLLEDPRYPIVINAVISILLDLWMLSLPLSQVWGLNMNIWRKCGLTIMFTLGTFATIVNVFRILVTKKFTRNDNVTWNNWDLMLWSSLEVAVGTVCACLPSLRIACLILYRRVSRLLPTRPRGMSRNRRRSPAPRPSKSSRTVTVCSAPPVRTSILNSIRSGLAAGQDRSSRQASSRHNTSTKTLRLGELSCEGEGRPRDEQEWEEQRHSASHGTGRRHIA